ncbi:MAG TPA: orotidine-5'-phosphate decarboxylase [Thermoplasmata archaeon]|nr:orotidine-5'-phosphate decarboxylase [Thermoplasmata archaeon]
MVRFEQRVDRILKARDSLLCVGLDPDPAQFPRPLRRQPPERAAATFLDGVVRATLPSAAAYKMQLGCYLGLGPAGPRLLARLTHRIGPTRLRILDLKANDVPHVMRMVRDAAFGSLGFDAITVTPWMGWETLEPFQDDEAHGVFLVAHSSNPGAADFQEIPTPRGPLWLAIVGEVRRLAAAKGNAGVVVGATFPEAIRLARTELGNGVPILVPGIGAQGGQLSATVRDGVDARGRALLVSASRSILYASAGADWKKAAAMESDRLRRQINQLRAGLGTDG